MSNKYSYLLVSLLHRLTNQPKVLLRQYSYLPVSLLLVLTVSPAAAQFEGKMVFDSYEITDGTREQNDRYTVYFTNDRIFLEGQNSYNFSGSIPTEGILVRLDMEDFVFYTGQNAAIKISKQEINSMMNMFDNGTSSGESNVDEAQEVDYEKTGETATLQGYGCEKFVFRDGETPGDYAVVWMTQGLDINWGMLAEPWGNSDIDLLGERLSTDLVFRDRYFPLKIEAYESGTLREVTEISEVSEAGVTRSLVEVPQGVQVLSFQDFLFNRMGQQ